MKVDGLPRFFLQGRSPDASVFSGFAKGELLQAEVVSQKGELLTLQTQDGRTFTARAQDGTIAEEGDTLRLMVTGRAESGEVLVQVRKGELNAHELLKMLKTDISREHVALASAFIKAGIVPAKQTMQELSVLLGIHKNLTAEQAVFMWQNNMPMDTQSIRAFQAFLQGQNGLGQSLAELGRVLDGLLAQSDTVGTQSSGQTDPVPATDEAALRPAVPVREGQSAGNGADIAQIVQDDPVRAPQGSPPQKAGGEALPQGNAERPHTMTGVEQPPSVPVPKEGVTQAAQTQDRPPVPAQAPQTAVPGQQDTVPNTTVSTVPRQAQAVDMGQPIPQGQPGQSSVPIPPPAVLPVSLAAAPEMTGVQAAVSPQPEVLPQTDTPVPVTAKQVAQQAKVLLDALFRGVTGRTAGEIAPELTGAKTVKEVANLMTFLERNADVLPPAARQAAARTAALASGALQLSEQMAPGVTVVPIPVAWGQHKTTAELFIWEDERRKGKKIDPANVTLFISLGTEHMGRVDTLVAVVGKHAECTFSSDVRQAVTLIGQHENDLGARMQEEGYRLVRMTAEQRIQPANLLTVQEEHRDKLRRTRFDRSV